MRAVQLGQHPPARHLIAHISDTHFLAPALDGNFGSQNIAQGRALYGVVDTDTPLRRALEQLRRTASQLDAIVFTGDIADQAEPAAYERIRSMVEPIAADAGAQVIWVMGNHDERERFRSVLLDDHESLSSHQPVDRVDNVRGLRVITLDSTIPGYHHGAIAPEQLDWLREVLRTPSEHGSILALHHPPIPSSIGAMSILELDNQNELADVVRGSDIRAILGGHLHYASTSLFAGIPVSVAAATCYTMDVSAPAQQLRGVSTGQSINLVHCYDDRIVHSVVPLAGGEVVADYGDEFLEEMRALTPFERREAFSRKPLTGEPS